MNLKELSDEIVREVTKELPDIDFCNIDYKSSLVDTYGINSFQIMKILICIEDNFNIIFDDDELVTDRYITFLDLIHMVEMKI